MVLLKESSGCREGNIVPFSQEIRVSGPIRSLVRRKLLLLLEHGRWRPGKVLLKEIHQRASKGRLLLLM